MSTGEDWRLTRLEEEYARGVADERERIIKALKALPCEDKGDGCDGCTALQILEYNDILKGENK